MRGLYTNTARPSAGHTTRGRALTPKGLIRSGSAHPSVTQGVLRNGRPAPQWANRGRQQVGSSPARRSSSARCAPLRWRQQRVGEVHRHLLGVILKEPAVLQQQAEAALGRAQLPGERCADVSASRPPLREAHCRQRLAAEAADARNDQLTPLLRGCNDGRDPGGRPLEHQPRDPLEELRHAGARLAIDLLEEVGLELGGPTLALLAGHVAPSGALDLVGDQDHREGRPCRSPARRLLSGQARPRRQLRERGAAHDVVHQDHAAGVVQRHAEHAAEALAAAHVPQAQGDRAGIELDRLRLEGKADGRRTIRVEGAILESGEQAALTDGLRAEHDHLVPPSGDGTNEICRRHRSHGGGADAQKG
mmetsp:Transcript_77132/g.238896  ORF Transcript_77132/g.238896 Transcript_77132/m.238896 type:complete len:363 (+) Transcript_77132:36-1124(+)